MTEEIKDGVYSQVAGTVGRVNDGRFTIEVQNAKAKYPDYVTVWSSDIIVSQGDRISVKGWLSWKKSTVGEKVYVDVSLNQGQVVKHVASAPAYSDESPF